MKVYKVEFLIRKNGETNYFIYVNAKNQRDAKEIVKSLWAINLRVSHMFHITAKRSDLSKYELDRFYRVREY